MINASKDERQIQRIRENLYCQDNRMTGNPYFIVVEGERPDIKNSNTQIFFTQKAADEYIERNAHNMNDPWIWIKSGNASPEWCAVRHYFGGSD